MQFGLIGERLLHSYSPEIHKSIGTYSYELLELPKDRLAEFIKKRDFIGINVTIPYKEAVIPLLDEISDTAMKIGAVNTVINDNGRLIGYNTDFFGLKSLIEREGIILKNKKVAILGTGGTSKTASFVAKNLGASQIIRVSRSEKTYCITFSQLYQSHADVQIIINTTPVGMFPNVDAMPLNLDNFIHLEGVIDAVYNPLRTNLVLCAKERNIPSGGGLYMLSAQAVYASSLFTKTALDEDMILHAYNTVKRGKENIVLIGMPSSGKSAIGALLTDKLGKEFFDSDSEIVKKIKMPIRDFFKTYGEEKFRELEKEVISELSKKSGVVIATGGGTVLDNGNIRALKRNGVLVFLNRSLKNLAPTSSRPLSSDFSALSKMFELRYPIYKNAADIEVFGDNTLDAVAKDIIKELFS